MVYIFAGLVSFFLMCLGGAILHCGKLSYLNTQIVLSIAR